jgi:hypothetical protein
VHDLLGREKVLEDVGVIGVEREDLLPRASSRTSWRVKAPGCPASPATQENWW